MPRCGCVDACTDKHARVPTARIPLDAHCAARAFCRTRGQPSRPAPPPCTPPSGGTRPDGHSCATLIPPHAHSAGTRTPPHSHSAAPRIAGRTRTPPRRAFGPSRALRRTCTPLPSPFRQPRALGHAPRPPRGTTASAYTRSVTTCDPPPRALPQHTHPITTRAPAQSSIRKLRAPPPRSTGRPLSRRSVRQHAHSATTRAESRRALRHAAHSASGRAARHDTTRRAHARARVPTALRALPPPALPPSGAPPTALPPSRPSRRPNPSICRASAAVATLRPRRLQSSAARATSGADAFGEHALFDIDVVLEPDARVAAPHRRQLRHRQLMAPDARHAPACTPAATSSSSALDRELEVALARRQRALARRARTARATAPRKPLLDQLARRCRDGRRRRARPPASRRARGCAAPSPPCRRPCS